MFRVQADRVGIVVSHAAHLLTVAGLIQRFRPHMLVVTTTRTGSGAGQTSIVSKVMSRLGLLERLTFLEFDEPESYERALTGDFGHHADMAVAILAWLEATNPDAVFGDGLELSNWQHDVCRAALDAAIEVRRRAGARVLNYEFPLSSVARGRDELRYGVFPGGPHEMIRLTPDEVLMKREVVEWASHLDPLVRRVGPLYPDELATERFRAVPAQRDYAVAPAEFDLYYDRLGRAAVADGRYQQAILFHQHFVPAARAIRRRMGLAAAA